MIECQDYTCQFSTMVTRHTVECTAPRGVCPRRNPECPRWHEVVNCDGCKYLTQIDFSVVVCSLSRCIDLDD